MSCLSMSQPFYQWHSSQTAQAVFSPVRGSGLAEAGRRGGGAGTESENTGMTGANRWQKSISLYPIGLAGPRSPITVPQKSKHYSRRKTGRKCLFGSPKDRLKNGLALSGCRDLFENPFHLVVKLRLNCFSTPRTKKTKTNEQHTAWLFGYRDWILCSDPRQSLRRFSGPDTPWDCYICLHWGGLGGQCRHI